MWDEKKVRILDIAEELGVSTATVSNVLHGKTQRVSTATIHRVQEKLVERGYIPNMAATLLAQNNSRIIGVIVHDHPKYAGHVLEDAFVSAAINALSDTLEHAGFFLMLRKAQAISEAVPFASMWNMDGMVLIGFCSEDYQKLRDQIRIPFVVFDGFTNPQRSYCNLALDDRDGGRQVGQYLRDLGHTQVLCLADNRLLPDWDRYLGLCEGLGKEADFWEIPMDWHARQQFYAAHRAALSGFTAVFAVSDEYAVEFMLFCLSHGISIPHDLSVIGFDGSKICEQVSPTLTSVSQDIPLRAKAALQCLLRMQEDPSYAVSQTFPVQLQCRMSSGEAKQ